MCRLAPPASSTKPMLLQLHHTDWHTCQFQMTESLYLYIQQHFELPSALPNHFSDCLEAIAEDSNPLGCWWCSRAIFTWWCEIHLSFLLFDCEKFHVFNFVIVVQWWKYFNNENSIYKDDRCLLDTLAQHSSIKQQRCSLSWCTGSSKCINT